VDLPLIQFIIEHFPAITGCVVAMIRLIKGVRWLLARVPDLSSFLPFQKSFA
jgi:hypothetical protein